ncbi:MAG: HAD family hydrolase [Solirubrobacteraceae bacterium]
MLRAVVFDVGETLVDETRYWSLLADRAGVPRLTLFGALGGLIERGQDHRQVWELLGVNHPSYQWTVAPTDLYPDVLPCFKTLRERGYRIGLAGNQPADAEASLRRLGLAVDLIASSGRWGVEKPDPAFFERLREEAELPAPAIAYVGDRLDNDIAPAKAAGMFSVFIRRGPWGHLHAELPGIERADARIDSLTQLPELLDHQSV